MKLGDSVRFLKGAGPRRGELLEKSGLATVEDLLYHLPFRYEDRRIITATSEVMVGVDTTLVGRIHGVRQARMRGRGGRSLLRALFDDGGEWIELVWFHQAAYFKERLAGSERWMVHGRIEAATRGGLRIVHPEIEPLDPDEAPGAKARILPVYQKPTDVPVAVIRSLVDQAVRGCAEQTRSVIPESFRRQHGLLSIPAALRYVHAPPADADLYEIETCSTPAHRTLIYEELFALQVGLQLKKVAARKTPGRSIPAARKRVEGFLRSLPFKPTKAQLRVIGEISVDLTSTTPMNRLLHGDVGSGKTVVAFASMLQAVAGGYQAALMAPTSLLAEQHFETLRPWAAAEGLRVELLSGKLTAGEAKAVRRAVAAGEIDILVGTHALVQESTEFARFGLAVIDEQHRFGVMQRATLRGDGIDTLLLSATPIPRTLSLTLYGDLDVSFLDELPPGRKPIVTRVLRASARDRLHERMSLLMREGRQCYVVYPLVEESEALDLADATGGADALAGGPFADFRVALVHGRMKPDARDDVMRRFKAGEVDVLVATTVIEVGIDVPNATVMVVENAERFGLAQLHQLRGRVGRGAEESFCCLVADAAQSRDAFERLRVMERTGDGFEIAEADLKLRGPGEYLGTRQSGIPAFRAANLVRDAELLTQARGDALTWLEEDPDLRRAESQPLRKAIRNRFQGVLDLADVG